MKNGKIRDFITIISFVVLLFGLIITWANGRTQRALIDDQVKRNTEKLSEINGKELNNRLERIEKNVDKIIDLLIAQ